MKPIEPGCVCRLVDHPLHRLRRQNVGRIVKVVGPSSDLLLEMIMNAKYWKVIGLPGSLVTQMGLSADAECAEVNLQRLDDDPDAAEPRIAEREVEHV